MVNIILKVKKTSVIIGRSFLFLVNLAIILVLIYIEVTKGEEYN